MRLGARPRGPLRSAARRLGAALALAAAGCDFPSPEACALECGPAGECPSSFECQAETRLCVPRGVREPCALAVAAPGGEARADAGELPGGPSDEPEPNARTDAGDASLPPEPQPELAIEPTP